MTTTLADALNQLHADPDTVQQGLRLFISEQTGDLTPREMLAELKAAAADPAELERALDSIENDPAGLNQAALLALDAAWKDAASRESVEASLRHAKESLPVVELGILAIVAMYAMYRVIPAQPVKETVITEWDEKGRFREKRVTEREGFLPLAAVMARVLKGR